MSHIHLKDVAFNYPVYEITGRSLKVTLMRNVVGSRLTRQADRIEVQALDGVNLDAKEGDRIGLIGRNGSGKSTLLRLLAGLVAPQRGVVDIEGRVVPLIARGLGINPELTGLQNIELPLRLLGATTDEVRRACQDIPEWTGLGDFMNMPVRTYSDGMRARLMFALCTAVDGDVMLLDEWLTAGDADFVSRAKERLDEVLARTGIVVVCSHSIDIIRKICNVVCWMDHGRIVMVGEPQSVIAAYVSATTAPPPPHAVAAE